MASVKTTMRRMLVLAVSVVGVLLAVPAHADDKVAAREHWERGTKFYDLGKYDDAIREFEAAYQAKSDPAFLYNLAQSHRLAGHSADALRFYRTYLRNNPKASNRADIEQRIAELEKVTSERPSASEPPPIVVSPPPPTAPPAETPSTASTAPPAATGTSSPPSWNGGAVTPPPLAPDSSFAGAPSPNAAPATATDASSAPPRSRRKTAAVVIAASGGAVFLVGALFGSVARSQSKKVETSAQKGEAFDPGVESLGKSSETLQWFGYGLGLAAIATGVVLYVTAPKPENTAPRVALAPMVSPQSGGALVRVTF